MVYRKAILSKYLMKLLVHFNQSLVDNLFTYCLFHFSQAIDLDYFEEAVDFLLGLKEVRQGQGVGILGISKAGDIALEIAAFLPSNKIAAVVAMNCIFNSLVTDLKYKGETVLEGRIF